MLFGVNSDSDTVELAGNKQSVIDRANSNWTRFSEKTKALFLDQPDLAAQINHVFRATFTVESERLQVHQLESLDWVRNCARFDPLPGETDLATIKEHYVALNTNADHETESFEVLEDYS